MSMPPDRFFLLPREEDAFEGEAKVDALERGKEDGDEALQGLVFEQFCCEDEDPFCA